MQLSRYLKNNENFHLMHWKSMYKIYLIYVYRAVNYKIHAKASESAFLLTSDWIQKILNQPLIFIRYFNLISKASTTSNHGKFTIYFYHFSVPKNIQFCINRTIRIAQFISTTCLSKFIHLNLELLLVQLHLNFIWSFVDDLRC